MSVLPMLPMLPMQNLCLSSGGQAQSGHNTSQRPRALCPALGPCCTGTFVALCPVVVPVRPSASAACHAGVCHARPPYLAVLTAVAAAVAAAVAPVVALGPDVAPVVAPDVAPVVALGLQRRRGASAACHAGFYLQRPAYLALLKACSFSWSSWVEIMCKMPVVVTKWPQKWPKSGHKMDTKWTPPPPSPPFLAHTAPQSHPPPTPSLLPPTRGRYCRFCPFHGKFPLSWDPREGKFPKFPLSWALPI